MYECTGNSFFFYNKNKKEKKTQERQDLNLQPTHLEYVIP